MSNDTKSKSFKPQQDETLEKKQKSSVDRYIVNRLLSYLKPYKTLISAAIASIIEA